MSNIYSAAVAALQAALGQVPAAPQAAQPAADVPGWVPEEFNDFDPSESDDPIIRSMATVMQTVGKDLDLDRVMSRALAYGDPALIDVAYLREKAGGNAEQLVTIAQGIVQAVNAKSDAVTASVYAAAGGEANWNAAVAVFIQSAPPELRLTAAQMLDSTKDTFINAGAKIIAEFGKNSGMIPQMGYWADQVILTAETEPKSMIVVVADLARSGPPMSSAFVAEFDRRLEGQSHVL